VVAIFEKDSLAAISPLGDMMRQTGHDNSGDP
jgi:hypothetical protein